MEIKDFYSTSEAASILGITAKTLRAWDKDGQFKPDDMDGTHRRYSKELLEKRLGHSLEPHPYPIMNFDRDRVADLVWMCEEHLVWDFDTANGNTVREKFESLFVTLANASNLIYRKTTYSPNLVLTSPEAGSLIEISVAFKPNPNGLLGDKQPIRFAGTLNSRWNMFNTVYFEPPQVLIGCVPCKEHAVREEPDFLAMIKIRNFAL